MIFILWKRREFDHIIDEFWLVYQEKKDNQDHNKKEKKELQDISCPATCLIIE